MAKSTKQQRPRITVLEQEAYLARILMRGLKKAGMQVRHFATGEAVLKDLADGKPDFMIVAADMSPTSGEEFCRQLQSEHPDRDFPVFVMTDSAQDLRTRWGHWFSNFRVIDKPISLRLILEYIGKNEGQTA